MRGKYISSTSGRKYLTENGLNDIDFPYDVKSLAVQRYVGTFYCTCTVSTITTSSLKSDATIVFYCALLCIYHCILRIDVLIYSAPQLKECSVN